MGENLKGKILSILDDLPSENSWLDYKIAPYDKNHKAEFIKDVCAFLNCTESYGKDKFIIFGVVDKTKYKKGINENRMEDDNYYQDLCDLIQPRPHIETGEFEIEKVFFGYVYIAKDNMERVYSIIKDYPEEVVTREEEKNNIKKKVYASTAYIRKGSVKYFLNEYDRRKIYEQDAQVKSMKNAENFTYAAPLIDDEAKEILKVCSLFGRWNEAKEAEKKIISEMLGKEYETWIKILRKLLSQKSEYVSFKNNVWKIEKKEELIVRYSEDFFVDDIKKFQAVALKILLEENPRFELEASQRIMSNILGKSMIYSKELKRSVLETFAFCQSITTKFINCEKELKKSGWYIVNETLKDASWKLYATIDELLPILAEINENEFLNQLNTFIMEKEDEVNKLFSEKEEYITTIGYTSGLYWGLELIAWNPTYLMQVFDIFGKLEKYDAKVVDIMSRILLPWYPQTKADINLRKATVEMVLKEYENVGWELLMKLMPKVQTTSFPTYKPKWNNIVDDEKEKVTNKEVYEQYTVYVKLAIKYSKNKPNRIIKLIDIMDDVPKDLFDVIYNKVISQEVIDIPEQERFCIWNEIEDLIVKHKKFSDAEWVLPKEAIEILEEMSNIVKPVNNEIHYKRLFNENYWDLFDEKGSYEEQERKILFKQIDAINDLLKSDIEKVIDFSKTVKDSYRVGMALAELELSEIDEKKVIRLLDNEEFLMAQGYVNRKFYKKHFDWLDSIDLNCISIVGKVRLLTQLPKNKYIWEKVTNLLGKDENVYWEEVDIRYVESDSEYDYPLENLLKCNRPVKALALINMALHDKRPFSKKIAVDALNNALQEQENINYIDVYSIKKIIKDLQNSKYDSQELFKIEWSYLPLLSDDDEYRPITIEKKLSEDPKVFNDIICLTYKAHNDDTNKQNTNEKLAMNAYRLLEIWKIVPGINKEGIIDKIKLNTWFEEMKRKAIKTDRVEVSLLTFGKVLYYSPKDKDDFWIDRSVAEILNKDGCEEIRRGYILEAYNSVGVVTIDREGTVWLNLARMWEERASDTELEYFRFAKTLRELASQFKEQAEYEREHYDF